MSVIWLAIIIRSLITARMRLRLTSLFCLGGTFPYSALPNHPEYVVCYDGKLQYQRIGFKLT